MTLITLELPEKTMAQAKQTAAALKRPVEEVLSEMLVAVLPSVQDVPEEMQVELAKMTWLENRALWQIARHQMSLESQVELQELAVLQDSRPLTAGEQVRLEQLRQEYGRTTLRKARAYALLSLRGGKPLLNSV